MRILQAMMSALFIFVLGCQSASVKNPATAQIPAVSSSSIESEPWPRKLLAGSPFELLKKEPTAPGLREAGGSGDPMMECTVRNRKTGWSVTFDEQGFSFSLLELYDGHPQIEDWTRAGGGTYCRSLMRFINGEYKTVRIDDFTEFKEQAKNPGNTVTLDEDPWYFVDTRMPDDQ